MVPLASDIATELFHWQRYLYFRPWYSDSNVIDAASGEGYGLGLAAATATTSLGIDVSEEAVTHSITRYPHGTFEVEDVCEHDYSQHDLVLSFETIEHLSDPIKFLNALSSCPGRIVISTPNRKTHSPGNASSSDKPYNQYHTTEWTPLEFSELIAQQFMGRQVRFLSQAGTWPGLITEGLDDEAMYCIAVIGDGELPIWPNIGIAIPTVDNSKQLTEAINAYSRFYPGRTHFTVVTNGTSQEHLETITKMQESIPDLITILSNDTNQGYGKGANRGLEHLLDTGEFDLIAVSNDDVLPCVTCLSEIAMSYQALLANNVNVGAIAPKSNSVNGAQQVQIGEYTDIEGMMNLSELHFLENHSSVSQTFQLRGLSLFFNPEALRAVGGFDPRFNLGNMEDDDHNLRCTLAGYSLWIADGAFLHHHGSQTFAGLNIEYQASIQRNAEIFCWKWDLTDLNDWPLLTNAPENVSLFVPFNAEHESLFPVNMNGIPLDLITQVSDIEFATWVLQRLKVRHRNERLKVVEAILGGKVSAVAAVQKLQSSISETSTAA